MDRVLPGLALAAMLLLGTARAQEPLRHGFTATSDITVEITPEGMVTRQRSVRFQAYGAIPDNLRAGAGFPPRLATVTTVTEGSADEPRSRVEVTVDDLSGPAPRRIAAFSDPGSEGRLLGGGLFFVTTEPGCCASPALHHLRAVETGRLLFSASGPGEAGMASWMQVPNRHPTVERWAAFQGLVGTDAFDATKAALGRLRYGDRNGVVADLLLGMDPALQPEDFALDLPDCGALLWVEPGRAWVPGQPRRPAEGACRDASGYSPQNLFSLEHGTGPLGGFEVELSLRGTVYAAIPVREDRLDLANARLTPGVTLTPAP